MDFLSVAMRCLLEWCPSYMTRPDVVSRGFWPDEQSQDTGEDRGGLERSIQGMMRSPVVAVAGCVGCR